MNRFFAILGILLLTFFMGCEESGNKNRSGAKTKKDKHNGDISAATEGGGSLDGDDDNDGGGDGSDDDIQSEVDAKEDPESALDALGIDGNLPGPQQADDRSPEELLCEEGRRRANSKGNDNFNNIFDVLCDGNDTTATFRKVISEAYKGQGEPNITVVEKSTNKMFVTNLLFVYVIEVPLASPSQFADIKIYDKISGVGIQDKNSKLVTTVHRRKKFPGAGSVEEVTLDHQLLLAEGAALYDKRRTQINNYLLTEDTRDVTLSTEHLIDEDNEHYLTARGILFGMQAATSGSTDLVYVTELVVKNRIDPDRLTQTVLKLSKATQKLIYQTAVENGQ